MITYINLTPHTINIMKNGKTVLEVEPSGEIARVSCQYEKSTEINEIEFYSASYGEVTGLPPEKRDVIYIVSGMVFEAVKKSDLLRSGYACPGELVRNEKGQPIGCNGLRIN